MADYFGNTGFFVGPPPTTPQRDLNLQKADPATALSQNRTAQPPQGQDAQAFGTAIMDLLKQYQTMGTKPFVEQGLNAAEEQAKRVFQTPPSLIGANPNLQTSVRNANVSAVSPTIQSANNSAQTFGEQLNAFGNNVRTAQDFADRQEATKEAKANKLAEGYPFYKYPGDDTVFDSLTNEPLNFAEYKKRGGLGQEGSGAVFPDVREIGGASGSNKLLSVAEAKSLGVPYGTTQAEAAAMGITPVAPTGTSPTTTDGFKMSRNRGLTPNRPANIPTATWNQMSDYIKANSTTVNNNNYFDIWGQLADELKANNLNPTDFDQLFWYYLHPDGLPTYFKEKSPQTSPSSNNSIDSLIDQYLQ